MKTNQRVLMVVGFLSAMLYRLIPFRPPNVEPLMSVMMPFSKKATKTELFLFAFLSILTYDYFTAGVGLYTLTAGICYGIMGLWSSFYFKKTKLSVKNYILCSSAGVIFFDVMTGVIFGPLVYGGSYYVALIGQIPFTALHLMGGALAAIIISPFLKTVIDKLEFNVTRDIEARRRIQGIGSTSLILEDIVSASFDVDKRKLIKKEYNETN